MGRNGVAARQLVTLFQLGATGDLTDGQLLERFASRGGEAAEHAFAALVERHGPLVLRVCRSILRDEHAALDAFQATFLVLVSKAGSLRVGDSLAPWLHAVAYRVALCARSAAARRRRHELRHAGQVPTSTTGPADDRKELGAILHEEIGRLPDRYRVPIVLCDLEGHSHDEAARHLGWPVGTVKSRQARGRDRLRGRLVRRGLAPSIGLGSFFAGEAGAAPISETLTEATAAVAVRSSTTGTGAVPARVALLTREFLMHSMLGKCKWAATSLLALGVVAAGVSGLSPRVAGGPPVTGQKPEVPNTVQARADARRDGPGKVYFGQDGGLMAVDPKTGVVNNLLLPCDGRPRVSPDGRLVAFAREGSVWVRELDRVVEPRRLLDLGDATDTSPPPIWSHDGARLIVSLGRREPGKHGPWQFRTVRVNVDGSGPEELPIPAEDGVQGWSPDGWLLTASSRDAKIGWQLYVMRPDGSEMSQITEGGNPYYARFSPDGRRVVYSDGTTEERRGIWVVGRDGKGRRKVLPLSECWLASACWSPDGKRIAVLDVAKPKGNEPPKCRLVILEVDGDGRAEFPLEDVKQADMPDWR